MMIPLWSVLVWSIRVAKKRKPKELPPAHTELLPQPYAYVSLKKVFETAGVIVIEDHNYTHYSIRADAAVSKYMTEMGGELSE